MSTTKQKNKNTECIHHWTIEPPNGTMSIGNCKLCGETREFRNSFEYSSWYGSKAPSDVTPPQTNTEKSKSNTEKSKSNTEKSKSNTEKSK